MQSSIKDKIVCVTGSSGMVGREVVKLLENKAAKIICIDLVEPKETSSRQQFIKTDLRDFNSCLRAFEGGDIVIHCAGIKGSPDACRAFPSKFFVPMVQFNTNCMEAARLNNISDFVYLSSIGVYSPAEQFKEDALWQGFPSKNDWFGGWAKRVGEIQAESYRLEGNWDAIKIIRPANVYGRHDNFDPKGSMVVPSLIRKVFNATSELEVLGDGKPIRDFIHAHDVARAAIFVIENNVKEPINVGSGIGHSIAQLAETVIGASGKKLDICFTEAMSAGDSIRIMDTTKAQAHGFEPIMDLHAGISDTYSWFIENVDVIAKRFDGFA